MSYVAFNGYLHDRLNKDSLEARKQPEDRMTQEALDKHMQHTQPLATETIVSPVNDILRNIAGKALAEKAGKPILLVDSFPRCLASAVSANAHWGAPSGVLFFEC